MDVTSPNHVTVSADHAHCHRHCHCDDQLLVVHKSSSTSHVYCGPTATALKTSARCYEEELELRLENMRQRALAAERQVISERARLMRRLDELQAANSETLTRLGAQTQRTVDSLKSRVRLTTDRCHQLTHDLQRLEDQLELATAEKSRLETQLQQQHWLWGCGVDTHDAATQTADSYVDSSALYQQLASIAITRLHRLELRGSSSSSHLPSRDQPPANQRCRHASCPGSGDISQDDDQDTGPLSPTSRSHRHQCRSDDVTTTSDAKPRRMRPHSLLNLDILKKLQTSRRNHGNDVAAHSTRPIRVRHDVVTADVNADSVMTSNNGGPTSPKWSSFDRLHQRRNGLTALTHLTLNASE